MSTLFETERKDSKWLKNHNLPHICDFCGAPLQGYEDSDINDNLQMVGWLTVWCPEIDRMEMDEDITDEEFEERSKLHFQETF